MARKNLNSNIEQKGKNNLQLITGLFDFSNSEDLEISGNF